MRRGHSVISYGGRNYLPAAKGDAVERGEIAKQNFLTGKNCASSVALAFSDLINTDEITLARLSIGFGGGLARQRLTCGAVSAMAMILGGVLSDGQDRKYIYALIQRACGEFKKRAGSLICGELLSGSAAFDTSPAPDERTEEYYKSRPCAELIKAAAEITENIIEREGGKS